MRDVGVEEAEQAEEEDLWARKRTAREGEA